ncbi:MAG: hypothetical protein IPL61_24195 [Myxococcales bacterium]|nr:hypothetical protein [Myxococcales bacterium]
MRGDHARHRRQHRGAPDPRTPAQLDEALGALAITLSADEASALAAAVSADEVAGARCPEFQMAHLDSER